jgi:hypothetical protein
LLRFEKSKTSVAFSLKEDETASVATIAAAAPHYLESWGDVTITKGTYSLLNQLSVHYSIQNNFKMLCYRGME